MANQNDLEKLISNHQRRLQKLKEYHALEGMDTSLKIILEIEDITSEIKRLQSELDAIAIPKTPLYNISIIQQLLTTVFDDSTLTTFAYEYYPDVHKNFSEGISLQAKIELLVEYVRKDNRLEELLSLIQFSHPKTYAEFTPLLLQTPLYSIIKNTMASLIWDMFKYLSKPFLIVVFISTIIIFSYNNLPPLNITTFSVIIFSIICLSIFIGGLIIVVYWPTILIPLIETKIEANHSTILATLGKRLSERKQKKWANWEKRIEEILLTEKHIYHHQLNFIPKRHRQTVINLYLEHNTPTTDLVYNTTKKCLMYRFWPNFQVLNEAWQPLIDHLHSDMTTFETHATNFITLLEKTMGFGNGTPSKKPLQVNRFIGYKMAVGNSFAGLNFRPPLLFCVAQYENPTIDDLAEVYDLVKNQAYATIAVLLLFVDDNRKQEIQATLERKYSVLKACDIIVVNKSDVFTWGTTKNPQEAVRSSILAHVSLKAISPFVIHGPTPPTMFFGREKELRQIRDHLTHKSFAIMGGRRVGKTSIAFRLLHDYLPTANFYVIYLDVSTIKNEDEFLTLPLQNWQPASPNKAPNTMGELLTALPLTQPVALLLDEADKLVKLDNTLGWPIFNQLRAMVNSGYLRIVLIGERTLQNSLQDATSPLYNFADDILIGRLDFDTVVNLITQPMEKMDIFYDHRITNPIYQFTSGHPNVVQRFCHHVIDLLDKRNNKTLKLEDAELIIKQPKFQKDDLLGTYLSQATLLERIIVILLTQVPEKPYSASTLRQLLGEKFELNIPLRHVEAALQRLVNLRSILKDTAEGYVIVVSAIFSVMKQAKIVAAQDLLEQYLEDYELHGDVTLEEIAKLERL